MNTLSRRFLLFAALAGCVSFTGCDRKADVDPVGNTESEEDRDAAIREAFASDEDVATAKDATGDAALRKEIDAFFTDLGKAYRGADVDRLMELVSPRAMVAYAEKQGLLKFGPRFKRDPFLKGMERGTGNQAGRNAQLLGFDEHVLRRIEAISDNEAVAYVRMWNDLLATYRKMRWWLIRDENGQWAAYDYDDLDQNIRMSVLISAMAGDPEAALAYGEPLSRAVSQMQAFAQEELGEAELRKLRRDIEDVLQGDPPVGVAVFAHTMKYAILSQEEKYDEAFAALDTLEKLDPKVPLIHYGRGRLHSLNENPDAAIASYARYAELLGWDPEVCEVVADLYYGKDDREASAKYARMGLADNPNATGCLASLAAALPDGQTDEILAAIALTKDPETTYDLVLTHLLDKEAMASAKAVYAALKAALPESELIEAYAENFAETPVEEPTPD